VKSSSRTLSVPLQNSKEGLLHAFNERFLDVPRTHFPPDIEAVRQVLISVRVRQLVKTGRPITSQSSKSREVMHGTWAACQRVRVRRRAAGLSFGQSRAPRWSTPYLLSSVLRCCRCGSTMSGETRRPDRTHPQPRQHYTCYRRRTAKACDAPFVAQETLETQLLEILRTVSAPAGFFESIEADARGLAGLATARAKISQKQFDERLKQLTFMLELGDLSPEDYVSRRDALQALVSDGQPAGSSTLEGQQKALAGFVDAWPEMTIEERKRVVAAVFQEVRANEDGISRFLPRDEWKRFVSAVVGVLSAHGGVTERKTVCEFRT
jgi:Recombinase zinc beta ribbon domain